MKTGTAEGGRQRHPGTQPTKSECDELKRIIGTPNKSLDDVHKQFKSDMESYAGNWPEDSRFYSPILRRLVDTITSRDVTLAEAKANVSKLETCPGRPQKGIDAQREQHKAAVKASGDRGGEGDSGRH